MTLRDAIPYVAAAYLGVWVVILAYVGIIGRKLTRIERALDELDGDAPADRPAG